MDLNALLFHHQVALITAAHVPDEHETVTAFDRVRHFASRIMRLRDKMGVNQYPNGL